MRRAVAVLAVVAALGTFAAPAQAYNGLAGGELVPRGQDGIRSWVGFPGFGFAYHTLLADIVEVAPRFDLDYATSHGVYAPLLYLGLGADFKFKILRHKTFAMAFLFEPGFRIGYHPKAEEALFGMRLSPMLLGTLSVSQPVNILFRFGMPMEMVFTPAFVFSIPIAFGLGAEFSVGHNWGLYFVSDFGPDILAIEGGHTDVDFYFRSEFGMQYKF